MSIEFAKATLDELRQVMHPQYIAYYSSIIKSVVKDMARTKNYDVNSALREIFAQIAPNIGAPLKLQDFMRETLEIKSATRREHSYAEYKEYALDIARPDEVVPVAAGFGEITTSIENKEEFAAAQPIAVATPEQSKKEVPKDVRANIASIFKINKLYTFQRIFCMAELYKRSYIVLKSINRANNDGSATLQKFKWLYSSSTTPAVGYFNTLERINNICAIRLYQPSFPLVLPVNTSVNILIDEFSTQSFLLTNTRRFHFIGTTIEPSLPYSILIIRGSADGIFNFAYPIQILESLTVSFAIDENIIDLSTDPNNGFFLDFEILYLRNDLEDTQINAPDGTKK